MSINIFKIGDIAKVKSSKRIFAKQYVKSGIPFYRQKEIINKNNKEEIREPLFISKSTYYDIKKKYGVPVKGDLLITGVGSLGIPYLVDDEEFYFKDGNLIWVTDFSKDINSKYLYYWFSSETGQNTIWSRIIGSAQPALTIDFVKQLEMPMPNYDTQNKIVAILENYDKLIINNKKQIKLLEEAAQRLYKEWFIDFRFPGFENSKIVEGLPIGWRNEKLGSIIGTIPRTKQIKASEYLTNGKIPIIDQGRDFIAGYTNDIDSVVKVNGPVIVFGDHTRILKFIQFPFAKGADGTQLIVANNDCVPQSLLYLTLKNIDLSNYHYARHFKYLKEKSATIPTQEIANKFDKLVSVIFNKIQKCREICRTSQEARDRLLPKLMNGEINV